MISSGGKSRRHAGRSAAVVVGCGARHVESLLLDELLVFVEAGRADPRRLHPPLYVMVPSRSLCHHLAAQLVRRAGRAVAGISILTHQRMASEVLERCGEPRGAGNEPFSVLVRQQARRVAALRRELDGLEDGYGLVAAGVSDFLDAGFVPAHADAMDEYLASLDAPLSQRQRARALVEVTVRTHEALEALGLESRASLLVRARECLEADPERALPANGVLVHGFADATGVTSDWIEALLRQRSARVFLDAPPDPAFPQQPDLGAAFGERLRARLAAVVPAETQAGEGCAAEIDCFRANGAKAEVRELAVRIRERLDAGAVPERIAVVARQPEAYLRSLRIQFQRLGIPFSAVGIQGPTGPVGRRASLLLELLRVRERMRCERWLDACRDLDAQSRHDLRLALLAAGAARLSDVAQLDVERLLDGEGSVPLPVRHGFSEAEARAPRRRLAATQVEAMLARAAKRCAHFAAEPESLTLGQRLADVLQLLQQELCWDLNAGEVAPLVQQLRRLEAEAPGDFVLSAMEFTALLERSFQSCTRLPLGGEGGGVQILDVVEARARSFDELFLIGMNRDVFPRIVLEDPLLPDSLRAALREVLPDFPVKSRGFDEERYLFAQLLSASARVTLSWQAISEQGKAKSASPLVERLLAERSALEVPTVASLQARATLEERRDALRPAHEWAVLAGLHGRRSDVEALFAPALAEQHAMQDASRLEPGALGAARLAVVRELDGFQPDRPRLGPFFGFVGALREANDPRRAPLYVTTLERLAGCPWQVFLQRLLRIEPGVDSIDAFSVSDARLVGALVHDVLDELVQRAHPQPAPQLEAARVAEASSIPWPDHEDFDALLSEKATQRVALEGIGLPGFERVLCALARPMLERIRELDWADGVASGVVGSEVNGHVSLRGAGGVERQVAFRADRVDRIDGTLRLTDYKTGGAFSSNLTPEGRRKAFLRDVREGRLLQAAAYALGAAGDEALGRYLYARPGLDDRRAIFSIEKTDAEFGQAFHDVASRVLNVWEHGSFFPRLVTSDAAREPVRCDWCDVSQACLRGDSGARQRLTAWAERGGSGREPAQGALREAWPLGGRS